LKKEITIAATSAIALIILLGSVSYLLFPQVSVQAYTATIDVYTQHGGQGKDKPSGNFTKLETVHLYAEVKNTSNTPLGAKLVSFEVHWPDNGTGSILILGTAQTNPSGTAEKSFTIPPSTRSIGRWLVYVTTQVDEQIIVDTLTFWCNG
jgi:hypothetical protein